MADVVRSKRRRSDRKSSPLPLKTDVHPDISGRYFPFAYVAAALAALIWVSRYWSCREFGLYEDDFMRIPPAMAMSAGQLPRFYAQMFALRSTQGRPFHEVFTFTAGALAGHWGGLTLMYVIGFLIVTANAVLFYFLMKRLKAGALTAALGALAFALFPADVTSQLYLTLSFGGQTSLTFFLLAAHAYLSGRRLLAYPLIAAALFGYETVFPLALAIPLLGRRWDRKLLREWVLHCAGLGAMLVGAAILRTKLHAVVVETPSLAEALTWPFRQMAVGPVVAVGSFFFRPWEIFENLETRWLWGLVPLFLGMLLVIDWIKIPSAVKVRQCWSAGDRDGASQAIRTHFASLLRTARDGIVLLVLAYPLAFTVPAEVSFGRGSRVHMPAAIGGAMLFACLGGGVVLITRLSRVRLIGALLVALLFTGMAGLGMKIQDDYRTSWLYQRALWRDVVRLCPDATEGTVILITEGQLRETREILSWGWYTSEMLDDIYRFPREWKSRPTAFFLDRYWEHYVENTGKLVSGINFKGWEHHVSSDPEFILLDTGRDGLRRRTGTVSVGDFRFPLKEQTATGELPYEHRLLYDLLIGDDTLPPVRYWH